MDLGRTAQTKREWRRRSDETVVQWTARVLRAPYSHLNPGAVESFECHYDMAGGYCSLVEMRVLLRQWCDQCDAA